MESNEIITNEYLAFLGAKGFPCIAAKAALSKNHIQCLVAAHMGCPVSDGDILNFLYDFVDAYRASHESYFSAAVIFQKPTDIQEQDFDQLLWQRLKALSSLDKRNYRHDARVDSDPSSTHYSFSLKEEAFFIIGLNPASHRKSRQFKYPAIVFNPHAEFEKLRNANRYTKLKAAVRKRDIIYSGSVNPMLADFGDASEVYQYSGIEYSPDWVCPLLHT